MKAPYGWTVVGRADARKGWRVYKRDCPADAAHFAADLAPYTFPTRKDARAAGMRGEFAYNRFQHND